MKKSFIMLLTAVMLLLAACGGNAAPGVSSVPSGTPSTQAAATQMPASGNPPMTFPLKATLDETVLIDQNNVKITATGLTYTDYDAQLALTIENNTDKNLSFRSGTFGYNCNSVNGYMFDGGYLSADISAGKKSKETVSFRVDELTTLGLTDIADLEIGFDISDDSYDTYFQTGPLSMKTSLASTYDYTTDTYQNSINGGALSSLVSYTLDHFSDEILFDQRGICVTSQTLITTSDGDKVLFLEVENTSSEQVFVTVGDFHVNGLMIQSKNFSTETINTGKRRVITAKLTNMLDNAYWEIFGLTELADITFTLQLEDSDSNTLCAPKEISVAVPGIRSSFDDRGEELYSGNDVRIVFKGLTEDALSYSDDIHALFLVENSGSTLVSVRIAHDSVSVNEFMTDTWSSSRDILSGRSAVLELSLRGDSLEENGIGGMDSIENIEATFTIRDSSYKTLTEPVVAISIKASG